MVDLNRRDFLGALAASAAAMALPDVRRAWGQAPAGRPNIIYVLADDMGYGDLGCYGHEHIRTPSLDAFAREGVKLTDCYAAAAICSPARAGFLTGRTPNRTGIYTICSSRSAPMHLPAEEITVARLLRDAGYQTCITGKWHLNTTLGAAGEPGPAEHGFEHCFVTENNARPSHKDPDNFVRNGQALGKLPGYSSEIIVDEAVGWMKARDATRPFFLYMPLHSPHDPIATPEEFVRMYPGVERGKAEYYGNISHLDSQFGRLMKALDELGLRENTFVVFTSDNGPQERNAYQGTHNCFGSPGSFRGMKTYLYEAGIRVPGIIRWPGHARPGTVSAEPVSGVDMLPTFCALAGVPLPQRRLDGANVLSLLEEKPVQRAVPLYWQFYRGPLGPSANKSSIRVAMRDGDWKICARLSAPQRPATSFFRQVDMDFVATATLTEFELYNLKDDPGETADLAGRQPQRLQAMVEKVTEFYTELQADCHKWKMSS